MVELETIWGGLMRAHILWFLAILSCTAILAFPEIIIIAHPDTPVSLLKREEIRDIFTGKKTLWNNTTKITISILTDSDAHRKFVRDFIKKTPAQFKNFWRQKVFTSEGTIPRTFQTEESMIEFVAKTKGAVG